MPTAEQIREALKVVIDPELRHNIVDLGMVRSIETPAEGRVDVDILVTHQFALDQADSAFSLPAECRDGAVKTIILPNQ